MQPGDSVKIALYESPTTGYSWHVIHTQANSISDLLTVTKEEFVRPTEQSNGEEVGVKGGAGTKFITFESMDDVTEGRQQIKLVYARSWEFASVLNADGSLNYPKIREEKINIRSVQVEVAVIPKQPVHIQ